jgi:hypothetical protein
MACSLFGDLAQNGFLKAQTDERFDQHQIAYPGLDHRAVDQIHGRP